MIHPDAKLQFVSETMGYGLFAGRFIPKGTITWVQDPLDLVLSKDEVGGLPVVLQPVVDKYSFVNSKNELVLCWDFGRYINHSCNYSVGSVGNFCEVAVRDIHPGEEISCDYATLNLREALTCFCGAENCRGVIGQGDLLNITEQMDREVRDALSFASQIEQPLWGLLTEQQKMSIHSGIASVGRVPSSLDNLPAQLS